MKQDGTNVCFLLFYFRFLVVTEFSAASHHVYAQITHKLVGFSLAQLSAAVHIRTKRSLKIHQFRYRFNDYKSDFSTDPVYNKHLECRSAMDS